MYFAGGVLRMHFDAGFYEDGMTFGIFKWTSTQGQMND